MRTPSKRCPVPGCSTLCNPKYLMCIRHWRMVAAPIPNAVWSNYRLAPGSVAHLAACQAAIRSASEMAAVLPSPATKRLRSTLP